MMSARVRNAFMRQMNYETHTFAHMQQYANEMKLSSVPDLSSRSIWRALRHMMIEGAEATCWDKTLERE